MRWDEEVAKKEKMCPMTLRVGNDGRFQGHKCVGSECMAWRGTTEVTATLSTFIEGEVAKESKVTKKAIGYCGMAGPPE